MNWEQWIKENKPKLEHVANFEERFVREILTKIPEITPQDLIAQYPFQDFNGGNRYIDFCIKNDVKGFFVSIELDGQGKDFTETLERQNLIIVKQLGTLLRFANTTWLNKPGLVIQNIRTVLQNQQEAFKEHVRKEDIERIIKNQQRELEILKQQANTDEVKRLTAIVNELATQQSQQHGNENSQDLNRVLLGLAQQINNLNLASPPVPKSNSNTWQFAALGGTLVGIGLTAWAFMPTHEADLKPNPVYQKSPVQVQQPEEITEIESTPASAKVIAQEKPIKVASEPTFEVAPPKITETSNTISSKDASMHIGKYKIVCGYVSQITPREGRTYLNLGGNFPNQDIAIVVWASDADKIGDTTIFENKELCVKGKITSYKGTTQLKLSKLSQLVS